MTTLLLLFALGALSPDPTIGLAIQRVAVINAAELCAAIPKADKPAALAALQPLLTMEPADLVAQLNQPQCGVASKPLATALWGAFHEALIRQHSSVPVKSPEDWLTYEQGIAGPVVHECAGALGVP